MGVYGIRDEKYLEREDTELKSEASKHIGAKFVLGSRPNNVRINDVSNASAIGLYMLLGFGLGYFYNDINMALLELWCKVYGLIY